MFSHQPNLKSIPAHLPLHSSTTNISSLLLVVQQGKIPHSPCPTPCYRPLTLQPHGPVYMGRGPRGPETNIRRPQNNRYQLLTVCTQCTLCSHSVVYVPFKDEMSVDCISKTVPHIYLCTCTYRGERGATYVHYCQPMMASGL